MYEITLFTGSTPGTGTAYNFSAWPLISIQCICGITDVVRIEVSNDETNFVTRYTFTGSGLIGLYNYTRIRVVLVSGDVTVLAIGTRRFPL